MNIVLSTAPTLYPISLDELKMHLRVETTDLDEDNLLESVRLAAIGHVENYTRRSIMTQTWDYYLDRFPCDDFIALPFGNLQSVTHVKYTDSDASQTTMTVTTEYLVETNGEGYGKVVLPYGVSWPSFTAYTTHPIVIRFVCGWTTAALVPYMIKAAIKMVAADIYANREGKVFSVSGGYQENQTVKNLLSSYRLWDEF